MQLGPTQIPFVSRFSFSHHFFRKSSCSPSSDTDKGVVGLSSSCFLGETKSLPLDHRVRSQDPPLEWLEVHVTSKPTSQKIEPKSLPPKLATQFWCGFLARRFESNYRRIQCIIELPVLAHWAIFVRIHDCWECCLLKGFVEATLRSSLVCVVRFSKVFVGSLISWQRVAK